MLNLSSTQALMSVRSSYPDDTNLRAIEFYRRRGYATFKTTRGRSEDERCFFMRKPL